MTKSQLQKEYDILKDWALAAKRRFEREDTGVGYGRPGIAWAMHDDLKTAFEKIGKLRWNREVKSHDDSQEKKAT